MKSLYDPSLTFAENVQHGPFFEGEISKRMVPPRSEWKTILGKKIMSPLGLFSCPFVVSERGMKLASELGFDIITWKTIRNLPSAAHPMPNVGYVERCEGGMQARTIAPSSYDELAFAISIGNSCFDLSDTLEEMQRGMAHMKEGQLFNLSIYGIGQTRAELTHDFATLAARVNEINPDAVEANLSCPNVNGLLYEDPSLVYELCSAMTKVLGHTPLIIKLGIFNSYAAMEECFITAARAGVQGVSAINAIGMKVFAQDGSYYFGEKRPAVGIGGAPIIPQAVQFTRDAKKIIKNHHLNLTLLAGGGITMPNHIDLFFEAGADAVLSATGALHNPYLMHEYRMMTQTISHHQYTKAHHEL
jgi:dihydroorotate dehydrogenase (NAD+) catalytic subunit